MKYRILALIVIILLMLSSISVYASNYDYTISTDNNFISAKNGDDLTVISEKLNMTPQDLNSYFTKNGLLYIAVSLDGKTQVKISAFTDNLSSEVGDISSLSNDVMTQFIDSVSRDAATPAQIVINNDRKFLCLKSTLKDSGGVYTVTQYITICNNKTYYFTGYNDGEDTAQEISDIFNSFKLNKMATRSNNNPVKSDDELILPTILINCGIVVFILIAVIALLGIIKSYLKKNEEQNEYED